MLGTLLSGHRWGEEGTLLGIPFWASSPKLITREGLLDIFKCRMVPLRFKKFDPDLFYMRGILMQSLIGRDLLDFFEISAEDSPTEESMEILRSISSDQVNVCFLEIERDLFEVFVKQEALTKEQFGIGA